MTLDMTRWERVPKRCRYDGAGCGKEWEGNAFVGTPRINGRVEGLCDTCVDATVPPPPPPPAEIELDVPRHTWHDNF